MGLFCQKKLKLRIVTNINYIKDKSMKLNLEREDLKSISKEVIEVLKPLLKNTKKSAESDIVYDVNGLAEYLKVNKSWVYNKVHLKEIPHFKCGKYTRFKKSQIDKWIDSETIQAVPALSLANNRG
jgi:excisionase family DNA binding protein